MNQPQNHSRLKLFGDRQRELADREHFLAVASRVMRRVVDGAQARTTMKRGADVQALAWVGDNDPSRMQKRSHPRDTGHLAAAKRIEVVYAEQRWVT